MTIRLMTGRTIKATEVSFLNLTTVRVFYDNGTAHEDFLIAEFDTITE